MSDSSREAHAGQLASVGSSSRASPAIYKKLVALAKEPIHVKKAYAYGEVVKKLNTSRVRGLPFQPAMCFKDVYESLGVEVTNGKSVTMQKIWQLVQAITSEDSAVRQGVSKRMSLAIGARRHLQRGHEKHIMDTIQSHPTQASLGNLQRIRAFLGIRLREYGSLDFDPPDSPRQAFLDTTWQQIYFCLRTGYYEEAREIARSTHSAQQFAPLLTEWIATDGMVAAETAAIATEECEKMLRTDGLLGRTAYDEKKLLVYTIISGSRRQIERILRDLSTLFNTIEDLLWFKLSCVRDVTGGSPSVVLNDGFAPYSFDDLQAYLNKSEPSYYTKNENDPLVYPYVLLLSIQFLPAVLHLSKEAVDRGYLIDAVHIAISLVDHSVISQGSGTGIMDANAEASSIIQQYVSMFLIHGDLQMTAEYYVQAAVTVGGGQLAWSGRSSVDQQRQRNLMLTQLLTGILRREGGIYSLLGARGSGEEDQLGRFFPDSRLRHQFLIEAAHHFQDAGSYDKSIEIQKRVGAFSAALETINKCLSEAICFLAHGWLDGESQTAGLLLLGNDILQTYNCYPEVSLQEKKRVMEQENILRELEAIMLIHKLASQGDHLEALRGIAKLPSLHLDPRLPDATVDVFQSAPPYLQTCVPDLLRVALTCLDNVNVPDTDGSNHAIRSKIAGLLASNTHRNWPRDLYEKATERPNSSEFSSSEPKLQEKQKKALLLKTETLKRKLEGLQILSERLHGESCKHLSRSELTLLRCLLLQGRLNVEDQLAQKKKKMEDDKVLEQENKDSFARQLELSKKRSILRWKRKDHRLFHEEVQRELEPVQMKKKIKYMKREIKRLQLLNERMIGNELHGMGYYELMALKKEILSTLLHVQSLRSSKKGEEEVLSVANGVKALELETSESDELDSCNLIPYCSKLGMSQQAVKAAKEAVLKCEDIDIRRSHIIIVAVVLYLITQLSDDKKPLKDISKATGVADVTIRNAYKELSPHFPKIAPSWYAKEEDLKNISSP